ncbi:MAG: thermonuclease family protein [Pseudomonadota bacterium]
MFQLLLAAVLTFTPVATMQGTAGVQDGDGIILNGVEVRMRGIAAPEDRGGPNTLGAAATRALERLARGEQVICFLDGSSARGRPVGVCFANNVDLNAEMVRLGFARDCPRFSGGEYADEEAEARAAGRNLSLSYRLPGYCGR